MQREGQSQQHPAYRQKTGYSKGYMAVSLLSPSSVDTAMNFSVPRALLYAQVGDILISV